MNCRVFEQTAGSSKKEWRT